MDNINTLAVGRKIRKVRELKGYSQENMANALGISTANYSKIERGEVKLSLDTLGSIIKVLEVNLETLMNFDELQIFNNCKDSNCGCHGTNIINPIEKIQELYERILKSKDEEIALLKSKLK
jgi:transcriptional regulator with XRE-family HTH domain